jgi:hypothetical protein
VVFLGADTPLPDTADAARRFEARAVVIGSSLSADGGEVTRGARVVRGSVDPAVEVLLGGTAEPIKVDGVAYLDSLRDLAEWAEAAGQQAAS